MRKTLSLIGVLAISQAGLLGGGVPAATADSGPVAAVTPASTVLLPTGDQVSVRSGPNGKRIFDIRPVATRGAARAMLHLRLGGHDYEVPGTALPYLGRGLDLSLFDIDALLAKETSGTVPVESSTAGPQPMDATAARGFGAALTRQFADDTRRGHYGGQGLFANGTTYALSGAAQPKRVQPRFVMRTVTVQAKDISGKPADTGLAFLYNTDDGTLLDPNLESVNFFSGGEAKYSVPEGNYSVLAVHWNANAEGQFTELRFSAQPEFAVSGETTVRVDASQANSQVTWQTPRPALLDDNGFLFRRAATTGPAMTVDVDGGPGVPISVSPTATAVHTGALQTYPYSRLVSPPGPGVPYEYRLQKAASGKIPQQRYVISAQDVATVDANYYSEQPSLGRRQLSGTFSFEDFGGRPANPIEVPRRQTEYDYAAPDLFWTGVFTPRSVELDGGFLADEGGQFDEWRQYQGGSAVTENWNKYPLHPSGDESQVPTGERFGRPAVIRDGDVVRFSLYPFSDNTSGHTGTAFIVADDLDTVSGHYRVTQDSKTIAQGDATQAFGSSNEFGLEQQVAPTPSTLGLTLDARRTGPTFTLSTASHTEWTWKSQHVDDTATVPVHTSCSDQDSMDRSCAVEPLLTLRYDVNGLRLNGWVPPGPQSIDLAVGHLQLSAASAITGATVEYSTDGKTWNDATVTGSAGSYHATYEVDDPDFVGPHVSLRVTASDATGATISETITDAYRVFH